MSDGSSVIEVQRAAGGECLPDDDSLCEWARAALGAEGRTAEVTIRLVDEAESAELNSRYRGRSGATNVLSFALEPPPGTGIDLLGDLAICAPVVRREADEQGKPQHAHWAHMVVHGVLHLLGHDHQSADEAAVMESLEIEILGRLGYPNPYEV